MFTNSIDYTVCSTDPNHYNRINCNLTAPITKYSALLVSSLTANCCIVVLNASDYIEIDEVKYSFNKDYSNLNPNTFSALLNLLFEKSGSLLKSQIDNAGRLVIYFNKPFTINSMTYNFKLITGFYNVDLPVVVGSKIVMRLNNSFSYGMPIFVSNADFETRMLSVDMLRGAERSGAPLSIKFKPQSSPMDFQKTPSEYMKF